MKFHLKAPYAAAGGQPEAIASIVNLLNAGKRRQTLLGVTGSGKTFIMANAIASTGRPALVLSHNKTLAAQLYEEFKEFFPENAVRYFVSYYDYYQPEAYIPNTDTYIEKDASINSFIDGLRHSATQAALTRNDLIIVSSVSAIYGIGNPARYKGFAITLVRGQKLSQKKFAERLASMQYERNDIERMPGTWLKKGDVYTVSLPTGDQLARVAFFGNEIEQLSMSPHVPDPEFKDTESLTIFPAKHFMATNDNIDRAVTAIENELKERQNMLKKAGKLLEADRLEKRVRYDMAMLKESGYTTGIENYSRHLDGRAAGEPPSTLFEYMPENFITFIDESHMTVPQIRGMYHGDRSRKETLVEHGFRLPSALDNRPLKFEEFQKRAGQIVFVSATPSDYERACGNVTEQLIRPTGLLDPEVEIRPAENQVKNAAVEIEERAKAHERTLVIALTKRMAEDIAEFLSARGIRAAWLHSEIKTLERVEILRNLRLGKFDALVGINLLREGIDLPEVSLVCILDADKEGFLRNEISFMQTIGRASRHTRGRAILYADKITDSMRKAVDETARRRKLQKEFNKKHGITPTALKKEIRTLLFSDAKKLTRENALHKLKSEKRSVSEMKREIETEMLEEASKLNFERAAELRDILKSL